MIYTQHYIATRLVYDYLLLLRAQLLPHLGGNGTFDSRDDRFSRGLDPFHVLPEKHVPRGTRTLGHVQSRD